MSSSPARPLLAPGPPRSLPQAPHSRVGSASCPFWHGGQTPGGTGAFPGAGSPRAQGPALHPRSGSLPARPTGPQTLFPLVLRQRSTPTIKLSCLTASVCASPCEPPRCRRWQGPACPSPAAPQPPPIGGLPAPRDSGRGSAGGSRQARPRVCPALRRLATAAAVLRAGPSPPRPALGTYLHPEHPRPSGLPRAAVRLLSWPLGGAVLSQPPPCSAFSPVAPTIPRPLWLPAAPLPKLP